MDSYLAWFYATAVFLYELLSETGSLYVHLDATVSHYVKAVLDIVFSNERFRNQIGWWYNKWTNVAQYYQRNHDTLLFYCKGDNYTFNKQYWMTEHKKKVLSRGWDSNRVSGIRQLLVYDSNKAAAEIANPKYHRIVNLEDKPQGTAVPDIWNDIAYIGSGSSERTNYPTQKPEALLERIIRASSNEGDLVLDCFCGSGTTAAVAEKLKRRWIACDLGRFAIHTTRKRLLGIDNVRPFVVQNLGKYERQVWQKAEFGEEAAHLTRSYRKFILDLYHADMVEGYAWLHGVKGGRMVHVGSVDSPVAVGDVRQMAIEFRRAIGKGDGAPTRAGLDVLGWDFALDMNETAQQIAAEAGVKLRFLRIPREVLEKKAVNQGDITFFELAALDVDLHQRGRSITITLSDFMIPPDDVPDDVQKAVRHWQDWIDYWAVDFNYRDDTFHNQWQSYRTRKDRTLLTSVQHTYAEPGEYVALVKAIDILGNDTTKTLRVKVV